MKMRLLLLLFVLMLYGFGFGCVLFPRVVQAIAIKTATAGLTGPIPTVMAFLESRLYLVTLRAGGLVALLAGGFVTFATLKRSGQCRLGWGR